jgi:hypothetical protein
MARSGTQGGNGVQDLDWGSSQGWVTMTSGYMVIYYGSGSGSEPELSIVRDGDETCIVRIKKATGIRKHDGSDGDGGKTRVSDDLRYVLSEA